MLPFIGKGTPNRPFIKKPLKWEFGLENKLVSPFVPKNLPPKTSPELMEPPK